MRFELRCIPMSSSSYSPANESLDAFPWVPIRGQWISGCIPMSSNSYSPANGMNLWMHSHEFKFLFPSQWNESLDAFPWVPIRGQWISDCIPMSSYSRSMNLWMLEFKFLFPSQWISGCIPMSSYSPAKFLESFGWVPPMSCPSYFRNAPRIPQNAF